MLAAIACGLGGLYLVRAALVDVGGFTLGGPTATRQLRRLVGKRRFWAGGALILVVLLVSLDLYGSEELSQVVPLYSLSYVLIALIGQLFLGERVTLRRWIGILTIVTGVVVLLAVLSELRTCGRSYAEGRPRKTARPRGPCPTRSRAAENGNGVDKSEQRAPRQGEQRRERPLSSCTTAVLPSDTAPRPSGPCWTAIAFALALGAPGIALAHDGATGHTRSRTASP